jgi:hypothetical protein
MSAGISEVTSLLSHGMKHFLELHYYYYYYF